MPAEHADATSRELTDAELEAVAAGKELLAQIDPNYRNPYRRSSGWGAFAGRRPLPGRGGRVATNAANSGHGYA